jgi:nicotinamide-nucleotide amidase
MKRKDLNEVVGKLLIRKGITISVAESCTGGLISDRLTDVPGISASFLEGVTSYSNNSKTRLLGVPKKMIEKFGAVSSPVARAMAKGVAIGSGASIGLSTTGIAGPTGATPKKPVGLVYIGLYHKGKTCVKKFIFKGKRRDVKEKATRESFKLLYSVLKNK